MSGRLVSDPGPTLRRLSLERAVDFVGRYSQAAAPDVFRRAHVLLHTKVNDPCPTMVIEAMACGLPVAYAASGGTVELVGDERASASRTTTASTATTPPPAEAMAEAVTRVLADRERFSAAARRRAVERFALADWLDRHEAIFAALVPQDEGAPR